jgi:cell division septation protein DedD
MAGPSLQDMQDQFNQQAQQNTWAQAAAQQQLVHPMVPGGGYPPLPPMAMPQGLAPSGAMAMGGVPVAMSKLSLFAIALCLMLLGIFTFIGGFLLGIWFESPRSSSHVSRVGDVPALGMLPPQQQVYPPQQQAYLPPQIAEVPAQGGGGGVAQGVRQGAQDIGFSNIASTQAGYATQSAVTGVRVPGVPSFLTPLITATQYAVGQQLGYKAQQRVGRGLSGGVSNAPQTSASPQPSVSPQSGVGKETQVNPSSPQNDPNVMPSEPLSVKTPGESTQERPSPAPLSKGEKGDYTVQLGVYASKENAMSLVNHLQELNYSSVVTEGKSADGSTLYYVFSGDYKDYKMALDAAYQYVAQNIPGAIVVKMTQKNKGTT